MKVELKRLQVFLRMSQETICFAADIWIDGRKVGSAENEGHGGNTTVHVPADMRDALKAWCATQIPADYNETQRALLGFKDDDFDYAASAAKHADEWWVDHMVQQFLDAKEKARLAKATAKHDAYYKDRCSKYGTNAARFEVQKGSTRETRWVEFKRGTEVAARAAAEKKFKLENWTVIA